MWKKLCKVLLLLSIVGVIIGGGIYYKEYVVEPWGDSTEAFSNLFKVSTDADDNVYVIFDEKRAIKKISENGTLKYVLKPKDLDNSYLTYEDMAVDSKGNLYVLQNEMDPAGLVVNSEEIIRYLPSGKQDPSWSSYKHQFKTSEQQPTRHGTVMSMQVKNDTLYFFTQDQVKGTMTLRKMDAQGKGTIVTSFTVPATQPVAEIVGTDANNILYITKMGQVYQLNKGLLYSSTAQATTTKADASPFPSGIQLDAKQNAYFINQYGETVDMINLAKPSQVNQIITQKTASEDLSAEESVNAIAVAPSGNLVIGTDQHVVVLDKQNNLTTITYSALMKTYHYLYWIVIALGVWCLYLALKILYVEIYPYSLFAKQMLVTVPLVLIAVGAIFYVTYGKYKVEVQQEVQRELIHMAHDGQNLVQGDWLGGINSPADYQNADYLKIEKNLTFQDHYGKFYTTVYKYATNHLYSIIDDNYPMFAAAPTFKFEPGMTCQTRNVNDTWSEVTDYNLVVQQKGFLACQSSDDDGNWLFGLGPIFNTDKTQVVGVYEVGINTSAFTARVDKIMRQDLWMMGTLLLLLVVILVVGTRSMLRSIWKLQEGAGQLANEQWDVVVDIKSRDEVAVLANTFNFMAQNIRQYIAATTDLSNSYKRFVPQQQLDMLGKPSILDVHLGDQVEREMSVLVSTIRSFHEISKDMTPEENFAFMNKFLQYIAPAVRDHNGLINKYLGNGVLALFPDQPLSALQASVEMRQSLATYNAERVKRGKKPISIGIAIHKGPMVLGIIGEGQRLDGNVLSEDVNFVTELEALSEKVGATLLIPAELMRSIDQSGQFAYRTLGLLKFAGQEEAVELCDVFEADLDAQKKLKAKTKEMFERAIVMYQQGRFYDARELFIQVIKQNQDDKIAKLYFYQCDEFFQRGTSRDWQGTLDVT